MTFTTVTSTSSINWAVHSRPSAIECAPVRTNSGSASAPGAAAPGCASGAGNERRLAVQETYTDHQLAPGRHARLIAGLTATVAGHPLREKPARQLMVAPRRCGGRATRWRSITRRAPGSRTRWVWTPGRAAGAAPADPHRRPDAPTP
ncbi:BTAD domain-containing putative transcriptional regulator [Streptomyces sp.]|uniref:BTAD domain-containing putative transcriptional regulator n=1 Tax=Streptomyces sp. TaxID=1931 RepID=UPI0039C9B82C